MDLTSSRRPFFQSPRLFRRTELPLSLIGNNDNKMTSHVEDPLMTPAVDGTKNLTSAVNGQVTMTSDLQKIPSSSLGLILATAGDDVMALENDVRETAILSDSDNSPSHSPRKGDQSPVVDNPISHTASSGNPEIGSADDSENNHLDQVSFKTSNERGNGSAEQAKDGDNERPRSQTSEQLDNEISDRRGSGSSDQSGSCSSGNTGSGSTKRPVSGTSDSLGGRYLAPPGRGRSERTGRGSSERTESTRTVKDVDRSQAISSLRDFRNRVVEFESMRRPPRSSSSSSRIATKNMAAVSRTQSREPVVTANKEKGSAASDLCDSPSGGNIARNNSEANSRDVANVREQLPENRSQVKGNNNSSPSSFSPSNSDAKRKTDSNQPLSDTSGKSGGFDRSKQVVKCTTFSLVSELKVKYRTANDAEDNSPKAPAHCTAKDATPSKAASSPTSPEKHVRRLKIHEDDITQKSPSQENSKKLSTGSSSNTHRSTESSGEEQNKTSDSSANSPRNSEMVETSRLHSSATIPRSVEKDVRDSCGAQPVETRLHSSATIPRRVEKDVRDSCGTQPAETRLHSSATTTLNVEDDVLESYRTQPAETIQTAASGDEDMKAKVDQPEDVEKRPDPSEVKQEKANPLPGRSSPLRDQKANPLPERSSPLRDQKANPLPERSSPLRDQKANPLPGRLSPLRDQKANPLPETLSPLRDQKANPLPERVSPLRDQKANPLPGRSSPLRDQKANPLPERLSPLRDQKANPLPERLSPLRDQICHSSSLSASSHSVLSESSSSGARDTARPHQLSQDSRSSSEQEVLGSVLGVVVQTVCSACKEEYTAPRILPCLHTFCSGCIADFVTYPANSGYRESGGSSRDSLVAASTLNGQGVEGGEGVGVGEKRTVSCPECMREVEVPEDLDLLPRNFVVERRLVQMAAQASHSMEHSPGGDTQPAAILLCDCCGEGEAGTSGGAMVRCNACRENLCALCEEAHRRQKRTRHHVLNVITTRDVANMAADFEPEIFCPQHSEERLSLFCTCCSVPVCRECAGSDRHRRHKSEPLDAELFHQQMQDIHRLVRQAAPRVAAMETQLRHMSDVRARLRARAKEVEDEVQAFMDSYVDALEKHRKSLLAQVSAILEEKERAIDVTQHNLSDVKTDVEHTCRFVSEMLGFGTDMEILSVKGLITERLRRVNAMATKPRLSVTDFLRFCPQQPADVINNFQMFGQVLTRQAWPARSCLANDGAMTTARVGHKTTLTLLVKDTEGLPYPGSDVSVQAWLIFQNEAQKSVPVTVTRLQDGNYSIGFTPQQHGAHSLHVAVDGQAIKESPMRVGVKGKWREHRGVYQCCTFCHTGGKRDVPCACNARMPGGYLGCGHGHPGHPGGAHWSCCGKMADSSECGALFPQRASPVRQVTL